MLTITHSHEAGTIIDGTAKGDGSAEVLKQHRWRWGRSIGAWFIPRSRDHRPNMAAINSTAAALEAAGFDVSKQIDHSVRSVVEVEEGKLKRQADRAATLAAKADRAADREDAAWDRADSAGQALPPMGEPVKIGHHSEARHRNAIEKAHNSLGRAVEARTQSQEAMRRAEVAATTTERRYSVHQVARRIEMMEVEIRGVQRKLNGYTRGQGTPYAEEVPPVTGPARDYELERLAEWRDAEQYWQAVRDQQIAEGLATDYDQSQISKGGFVKVRGAWRRVARANPKTVSVETQYSWTDKVRYHEIQDYKEA